MATTAPSSSSPGLGHDMDWCGVHRTDIVALGILQQIWRHSNDKALILVTPGDFLDSEPDGGVPRIANHSRGADVEDLLIGDWYAVGRIEKSEREMDSSVGDMLSLVIDEFDREGEPIGFPSLVLVPEGGEGGFRER